MAFTPYNGDLLQHLASFVVLAHRIESDPRGAYDAAADELAIDVSVLRRRMQQLSTWFASDLTVGRGRDLALTQAGESIVSSASRTLLDLERMREELAELPARLALAYDGLLGADVIPALLRALMRSDPELTLSASRTSTDNALALLRRGRVDVAVVRLAAGADLARQGLVAEPMLEEKVVLVVGAEHALAQRGRLNARDIAHHGLALEANDGVTWRRCLERLTPLGAHVALEAESRAALIAFAELGLCAGLYGARRDPTARRGLVQSDVSRLFGATSYMLVHDPQRAPAALESLRTTLRRELTR